MSEAMSNLREHAQHLPSPGDALGAIRSHAPEIDLKVVRKGGKRTIVAALTGLIAVAALVTGYVRRHRGADVAATLYTPPMPKP